MLIAELKADRINNLRIAIEKYKNNHLAKEYPERISMQQIEAFLQRSEPELFKQVKIKTRTQMINALAETKEQHLKRLKRTP